MRLLPVIDLKNGQVVQARAGRRDEYQPVRSTIAEDASPSAVAWAFRHRFGAQQAYVADLNAIAGAPWDRQTLESIAATGLTLWLDAGLRSVGDARQILDALPPDVLTTLVSALESLDARTTLAAMIDLAGADRVAFSLDLRDGIPVTSMPEWRDAPPLDIVRDAVCLGVRRVIVLDVACVGMRQGPNHLALCRQITEEFPEIELTSGGGIRSRDDLLALAGCSCAWALVATALHDGTLSRDDMVIAAPAR